jgi:hypothetical protein
MGYVYARCVSLEQGFRTMNVRIYRNLTSQDVKHIAYARAKICCQTAINYVNDQSYARAFAQAIARALAQTSLYSNSRKTLK